MPSSGDLQALSCWVTGIISSALRLAADAAPAHESLAYYHVFREEWAKGVGVLEQFTQQHPNNPSGWYYYGRCLFHTGEYQRAAEAVLKAYRLYPNDCEIYRALCVELGEKSLLLEKFRNCPLESFLLKNQT